MDFYWTLAILFATSFGNDEIREFYGLEALWNDAGRVPFEGE